MTEGTSRVASVKEPQHPMLVSLEPVFLPSRPSTAGPLFSSDPLPAAEPGAKAVFSPAGQSVGYLMRGGKLVVQPGFTADLTGPFPARLVRLAMAAIPARDRNSDAVPLCDVSGQYVGYLAGPAFQGRDTENPSPSSTQTAGAPSVSAPGAAGNAAGLGGFSTTKMWAVGMGAAAVVGGGVAAGVTVSGGGGSKSPPPATPYRP